jgi:HSP20 family protein
VFDDFFLPNTTTEDGSLTWGWNPVVDIYDNEDNIVIKAELPGVSKKDIEIDIKDRILTLKGERFADNEVKEDTYYRRERTYGRFERSFTLPANVDPDKIKADYSDGVLKIEVPKPENQKPKQITVH